MVVLRFAPSPTGLMHVGNARTALVNWLFAQKSGGRFLLRFDDTDTKRSQQAYVDALKADLAWLGWNVDEVFHQSNRLDLYDEAVAHLKASGRLYPCYETPQELDFKRKRLMSSGRPPVYDRASLKLSEEERQAFEKEGRLPHWRFRLNADPVKWQDLTRGPLSYESTALSDPILVREDGTYVYTLCSVVDDLEKKITHIVRGNDHISNTAVQIQLVEALGGDVSQLHFAHLPLLTGEQGEGLSKRLGSLSLQDLREEGFEPMTLNAYLSQLGSSQEITPQKSLKALIERFDLKTYSANSPKFSLDDLTRLNARLLKSLSFEEVQPRLEELEIPHMTASLWEVIRENITFLKQAKKLELWLNEPLEPVIGEEDLDYLQQAQTLLPEGVWDESTWKTWTDALKAQTGRSGKTLFMPLRLALTAEAHGPEMKKLLPLIGREKTLKRLMGQVA